MCYLYWAECGNMENSVSLKIKTIVLGNKRAQIFVLQWKAFLLIYSEFLSMC